MEETIIDDFVVISHEDTHEASKHGAPSLLGDIGEVVDGLSEELWPVNKKIHDNPELGFKEFIAHETLTTLMRSKAGWKVTPSAYGMATAWVAVFDTGRRGPVVSFNAEMGWPSRTYRRSINPLLTTYCVKLRCFTGNRTCMRAQPYCYCLGWRGIGHGGDHEAAQSRWQGSPIRNTGGRRLVVPSLGNAPRRFLSRFVHAD